MLSDVIFKANDIRGVVVGSQPEWDAAGALALGSAFVRLLDLQGHEFVMGRDMRASGDELSRAFALGAQAAGASLIDIGLASTDELWFASGHWSVPGVQFTASHNPAHYNGIKFCLTDAAPVPAGFTTDLAREAQRPLVVAAEPGERRFWDALAPYAAHLRSLVDPRPRRRLTVVVDAGNGMAGHTAASVLDGIDLEIIGLYLTPDGSFPNHPPNPLVPENLRDAQAAVREHGADLALVFDGDADRCFIIDETGTVVDPSVVTALIAEQELEREPGAAIVINSITSRSVGEVVEQAGGRIVTSRVGHTYVKAQMAANDAVFGGEHSAHYYFRDFWGADTGMLAALHVLAMLSATDATLSELVRRFDRYVRSGELNSTVEDVDVTIARVRDAFAGRGTCVVDDGLTVTSEAEEWWFNLRPSNTEPLLRLNVEARERATMVNLRDTVLGLVRTDNA